MARLQPAAESSRRLQAFRMLALCTAFWGLSFPAMKALSLDQQQAFPQAGVWFITSLSVVVRFLTAAILLIPFVVTKPKPFTLLEIQQGLLIGAIGGIGILLQMDGLSYTSASTSAFLTQFYCVILPIWSAFRSKRRPSTRVLGCCVLVLIGVAILADFNLATLKLGRGELETLLASIIFTGQILWLEHPPFAENRTIPFTIVMFLTMAMMGLPVAIGTAPEGIGANWLNYYANPGSKIAMTLLVLISTLGGYLLMNHWQKHLPAAHAGLIYCLEPVFASAFALFVPGLFSSLARVPYDNESIGWRLIVGGTLVTIANAVLQWGSNSKNSCEE